MTDLLSLQTSHAFVVDGAPADGALFDPAAMAGMRPAVGDALEAVERGRATRPELSFLRLPEAYGAATGAAHFDGALLPALDRMREIADSVRGAGGDLVHVGIGGSALGATLLADALGDGAANVTVLDNVDPEGIERALARIRPDRTWVHAVSRSGGTVETLATLAVVYEHLRRQGVPADRLRERVIVTTSDDAGALGAIARETGFSTLPLPAAVRGRFSVLSPGCLLTAAVAGADLDALLAGAREADVATADGFDDNPVAQLAALHHLATTRGVNALILMPYVDRLRLVADWYAQLVGESLGKGGGGVTPVKAMGATDQHSQLQLYNDGPKDKLVLFFTVDDYGATQPIADVFPGAEAASRLAGHSLAELIAAEQRATAASLRLHGVPSAALHLARVDARRVGALLTCLQKTVAVLGELAGVDAFDQPGVEESKAYARAMLGAPGAEADELRARVARLEGHGGDASRATSRGTSPGTSPGTSSGAAAGGTSREGRSGRA